MTVGPIFACDDSSVDTDKTERVSRSVAGRRTRTETDRPQF
jgi:hypothetical protein